MSNILITGIESFVGKVLKNKINTKHKIYGIDKISFSKSTYKLDINSKKVANIIKKHKIDIIIHLAAISRDEDCKKDVHNCFKNNVLGTINLISQAKKYKVKQFIFASTEWVYNFENERETKKENDIIDINRINSEYALSKLISENNLRQFYAKDNFMDITILRFGIIYGNRLKNFSAVESLFMKVKNNENINVGSLKTSRQFIHVNDIVRGIIKSFNLKGFNILNLQGNDAITLKELLDCSINITGNKIKIYESNKGNPSIRKVSNLKAIKLINFRSKITVNEGLKDFNKYISRINQK